MKLRAVSISMLCWLMVMPWAQKPTAQTPAAEKPNAQTETPTATTAAAPSDPDLSAATQWIGRALFLRCFCAGDNLSFDAAGRVQGAAKTTDWTLAGVNVLKVERKAAGEIELDGIRADIRYAADRNEFDRRPQKDEKMKIVVADNGDPAAFEKALEAIFSEGIDRRLQRAMPAYWQHYFDPSMAWPQDAISGQTIYSIAGGVGANGAGSGDAAARLLHKANAGYTTAAARDHVHGTVRLHMVVDTEGIPRHIAIAEPLGDGLDARAAEAAAKYRFAAATVDGKPVDSTETLNQSFVVLQPPQ